MKTGIPTLIKSRRLFFKTLLTLISCSLLYMIFFGQQALIHEHPFWLNIFFINYTFMGDAIFVICLAAIIIFYFKKRKEGMTILTAFVFTELLVQLIKNLLNISNSGLFFEDGQTLFHPGFINASTYYSFPSGHTAIAFSLITVLILILKNKTWQLPLLAAAVLLAYSRIYLAQHFIQDVLIGAVLGTSAGVMAVHITYNWKSIAYKFRSMHKINHKDQLPSGTIQPV